MEYIKRDCSVQFSLKLTGEGRQTCDFSFFGEKHHFWISYAMGQLFGSLLDSVYGLCFEAHECQSGHFVEHVISSEESSCGAIIKSIGKSQWDCEGGTLDWTLVRNWEGDTSFVDVTLDYDSGDKVFNYRVEMADLCYAIAKAMTEVLKRDGFCGYHFSTIVDDINLVRLLVVKHMGFCGTAPYLIATHSIEEALYRSSLEEEIQLLQADM